MVDKSKLVEGATFWCILPDAESEGYGNTKPRKPWQGKLQIGSCHSLSRFDKDTGEVDEDTNSTALLGREPEQDLFNTEAEARDAYIAAFLDYCTIAAKQLGDYLFDLRTYSKRGSPAK